MHINDLLSKLVAQGVSDIHLHANMPPAARIEGKLQRFGQAKLNPQQLDMLLKSLCDEEQRGMLEREQQLDFSYTIPAVARFRVNMFRQQGALSAVLRVINSNESQLERVHLPDGLLDYLCTQEKGLILVTGPTGSGKSSTLSRVLDEINQRYPKMIVTIEDPIEYIHRPKQALIVQRERGRDVASFAKALVAAMRQDPDVIMLGEIRDYETAKAAIEAAQTGHLVLSTLHTLDTVRTVNRVIDLFPPHEREVARQLFGDSIVAILSQKLLPKQGGGRIAAIEVLKSTLRTRDLVKNAERTHELYAAIRDAKDDGMQLMDDVLVSFYAKGLIDYETGLHNSFSAQFFKMAATQVDLGISQASDALQGEGGLELEDESAPKASQYADSKLESTGETGESNPKIIKKARSIY